MAFPSSSLATLRPDLAPAPELFDLDMNIKGFVANKVAPVIEVPTASGNFAVVPIDQLLKERTTQRAPGGSYIRITGSFDPKTYTCVENGAEELLDDRERSMYKAYLDAELVATKRARQIVLNNYEKRIAALAHAVTNTAAGAVAWTSPTTATPITDVRAAADAIWARVGIWPNAVIMTRRRFNFVRDCAQIIDRVKYSGFTDPQRGKVTEQVIAEALGVDMLIVAGSAKNTANEGQTAVVGSIWTDSECIVACVPTSSDFREPGWLRTFHYGEDGSDISTVVESYRDETVRADVIRVRMDTAEVTIYADAAQRITGI